MSIARKVDQLVIGQPTTDGAGVSLTRLLTQDLQRRLDPFLMLDAFATDNPDDYIAGFPEHPHRGFETVTYMLEGNMRHRDSRGNEGLLGPGGVQWMTAGRGILHSEMPEQVNGRMEGFQLWLNLPAQDKMSDPAYSDIEPADIPVVTTADGILVKVIAGQLLMDETTPDRRIEQSGAVQRDHTEPLFIDLEFRHGGAASVSVPRGHNAFVYVCSGELYVGQDQTVVPAAHMAILSDGDFVQLSGSVTAHAILVAGKPLNEPIAQYGPFVMNTREQIIQAVEDMRAGTLA